MNNVATVESASVYSEVIHPNSDDKKGPLTFIDRRSNDKFVPR